MNVMWIIILVTGVARAATDTASTTSSVKVASKNQTPMHKAELTQRGYIQFLRWQMPVPEIQEFTFCVWVKSSNLTYPHSIFSYSKNEKDRLVRAWIAPNGQSIHLEINNIEIFAQSTSINVNQWYHICQSWDNAQGRYGLWIDGQIQLDGYASEMAGHVIPKNGDIVLGQEYTDFDKGLEEGIEGAVLGFNLLLASAFEASSPAFEGNQLGDDSSLEFSEFTQPKSIGPALFPRAPRAGYTLVHQSDQSVTTKPTLRSSISRIMARQLPITSTWQRNPPRSFSKPIGLRMIETGYFQCEVGRGSPFIGGSRLLISWTRTPVKVFGGAILKNVDSQCGVFNILNSK